MRTYPLGLFLLLGALAPVTRAAPPILLNFDFVTGMWNIPGLAVPTNVQLSAISASEWYVTFRSSDPAVALVDLGTGTTSPPTGIGGIESGVLRYSAPITVAFWNPVTLDPWVTSRVSVRADVFPEPGELIFIQAFDVHGAPIASALVPNPNGSALCELSAPGIHAFTFVGSPTVAFDDLSFDTPTPPAPACPADFNLDGIVDDLDFVLFAQAYDLFTVPPANPACDLNADTLVDDIDFVFFAQAYDQFVCG